MEAVLRMIQSDRLTRAALEGNVAKLRRLLDWGADPNGVNVYGRSAIQIMKLSDPEVAVVLLERGANPNVLDRSTGNLPVHDAAREGWLNTLQVLVAGGARLDVSNIYGRLPLDEAEYYRQDQVVHFLAQRQGDDA